METNQPKGYNTVFADMNAPGANHQPPSLDLNATMSVRDPLAQDKSNRPLAEMGRPELNYMKFKNNSTDPGDFKNPLGRDDSSFDINLETMPRANLQVSKVQEEKVIHSAQTMIY